MFGTIGTDKQKREEYDKLPPDLRKKFETRFRVD